MIDLRSDTVTKPSAEMRKVMAQAEVGDDIYKEDPTVNKLEEYSAELLGKEAALFVPSGTMGNQICLNVHTSPGDEVIIHKDAHIFHFESGSPAALSGLTLSQLPGEKGILDPADVEKAVRPEAAYYMARTRVIEIENTHNVAGGVIQPMDNIFALRKIADKYGLAFHMDGARLWNASVASGISPADYCAPLDSVSCCLSKGLGAPIGSVIAGSKDFIKEAFRIRKAWGGGMRQVGGIAAAGLYALQNNIPKLAGDHRKAIMIAESLMDTGAVDINPELVQTNIVMFSYKEKSADEVIRMFADEGIRLSAISADNFRIVTHMDVSFEDIQIVTEKIGKIFG